MKIFFSTLGVFIWPFLPLFAQAPAIQWQNTIGGNNGDILGPLQQTADGGYILGGISVSNISGDKTENDMGNGDIWVVKLNSTGAIQWQNTIGGNLLDGISSLQQTADGGYILGGYSESDISGDKTENNIGNLDFWVVKLNATGDIEWQNTIGGNDYDALSSVQLTSDGGYLLGGYSKSDISGDKTENSLGLLDYWVVKLNASGEIQWQNTIGGNDDDTLTSLQLTTDGGYILGGSSWSNISGDKTENNFGSTDYWVVKLNAVGDIQWQNTIGGNAADYLTSVQQTADGGYILGGFAWSGISGDKTENTFGGHDYWIVKLNEVGDIQWQNNIGGNGHDELIYLQQTVDSNYIVGGFSESNISGDKTENNLGLKSDIWILKLNESGDIQWQNTIGGKDNDEIGSLQLTKDGGFILGGYSLSSISDDKSENCLGWYDYWVLKLAPETVPTEEVPKASVGLIIYPNPTSDAVFLRSETSTTICLRNAFGQILSTQTIQSQSKIDLSPYPNGIYFLVDMETGVGHKILKVK